MQRVSACLVLLVYLTWLETGYAACGRDRGWVTSADGCILVRDDVSLSWVAARRNCSHDNADLASFPDKGDNQFLLDKLGVKTPYWVGYQSSPSAPGWLDGTSEATATRFTTGSVHPGPAASHLCGSVLVSVNRVLLWRLDDCSLPLPFVCKMPIPPDEALIPPVRQPSEPAAGLQRQAVRQRARRGQQGLRHTSTLALAELGATSDVNAVLSAPPLLEARHVRRSQVQALPGQKLRLDVRFETGMQKVAKFLEDGMHNAENLFNHGMRNGTKLSAWNMPIDINQSKHGMRKYATLKYEKHAHIPLTADTREANAAISNPMAPVTTDGPVASSKTHKPVTWRNARTGRLMQTQSFRFPAARRWRFLYRNVYRSANRMVREAKASASDLCCDDSWALAHNWCPPPHSLHFTRVCSVLNLTPIPVSVPNTVSPVSVPNTVPPVSVPNAVSPVSVPNTVPPVSVPNTVPPVSVLNTVSPVSVPNTVSPVSVPNTVSPVSVPNTVPPVSVPNTVPPVSVLNTVSPVSVPNTVSPVSVPNTVPLVSVPNTLASVTSTNKVPPVTVSNKVSPVTVSSKVLPVTSPSSSAADGRLQTKLTMTIKTHAADVSFITPDVIQSDVKLQAAADASADLSSEAVVDLYGNTLPPIPPATSTSLDTLTSTLSPSLAMATLGTTVEPVPLRTLAAGTSQQTVPELSPSVRTPDADPASSANWPNHVTQTTQATQSHLRHFLDDFKCNATYACLANVLLTAGLSGPDMVYFLTQPLFRDVIADSTFGNLSAPADPAWKSSLQIFFWIVNNYLDSSDSPYFRSVNTTLEQILYTVDSFLENTVNMIELNNTERWHFSHLDFQVEKVSASSLQVFQFQDEASTCSISSVSMAGNESDDLLLVSVVMHFQERLIDLQTEEQGDQMAQGLMVSPILIFSGYLHGRPRALQHSFRLNAHFQTIPVNSSFTPRCVYLDMASRVWSRDGCERTGWDVAGGLVECRCNHTSNFAILMQVVPFQLDDVHKTALSIITYVGCSVTLVTQLMAVTVFTCVGSLNCERVCVHRNLCIAIASAQVAFLAGAEAVANRVVCSLVALLLHYLYLAVFTWMLVEGLHLYSQVVRVFGTERSRMLYYVVFGWGVPALMVAISAAADWDGYGTPTSCWLSAQKSTVWAFVGPALAVIIINLIILVAVVKIVVGSSKLDKRRFYHVRAGAKAALLLLPLMGLTWIFGMAAVTQELVVFQYLFAISNTLQGFFIFLFHCAFNTEVRQALRRLQEQRTLQRGELSSVSSYSHCPSAPSVPYTNTREARLMLNSGNVDFPGSYRPKINRVVPAGYMTTTTIANTTSTSPSGDSTQDGRCSGFSLSQHNKSEEMALMFI